MKQFKEGDKIGFEHVEVGMRVTARRGGEDGVVITGRVVRLDNGAVTQVTDAKGRQVDYYLGAVNDDWWVAEDWSEPLPHVEGLYVASWEAKHPTMRPDAEANVLGLWQDRASSGWHFKPIDSGIASIHESRIISLTPVTVVPDEALSLLAGLHIDWPDDSIRAYEAISKFFLLANSIKNEVPF